MLWLELDPEDDWIELLWLELDPFRCFDSRILLLVPVLLSAVVELLSSAPARLSPDAENSAPARLSPDAENAKTRPTTARTPITGTHTCFFSQPMFIIVAC